MEEATRPWLKVLRVPRKRVFRSTLALRARLVKKDMLRRARQNENEKLETQEDIVRKFQRSDWL